MGTTIGVNAWLHGRDPFPDLRLFYLAFYAFLGVAVSLMIRAAAVRVRWTQFLIDAAILVVGFWRASSGLLIIHSGRVERRSRRCSRMR